MLTKKSFATLRSSASLCSTSLLASLIVAILIASPAVAKSVYAITNHAGTLRAYEIQGDKLVKPYWAEGWFGGAGDVTIDSNLKLLFITFEGSNIVWADAETLAEKGSLDTPMMAGIVADEAKQRIYSVERGGNQLYICEWDDAKEELVQLDIVTLADLGSSGGWGIALDKITRRLYVANNTNIVHYYDADDPNWIHLGTRDVEWAAMDIEVDPVRGYLYVGGFQPPAGGSHTYLVKHELDCEANCNTGKNIETVATGLAVDPGTGLVYVTTSSREIRVYDCSGSNFVCTDSESTDGGPAGICVESALVQLTKVDVNEPNCVGPGDYITYTIDYNYPSGPNCPDYNDVNIIDYLPPQVDFNWASGPNCTQPDSNTVVWHIGTLRPGDAGFVRLKVEVKPCIQPGIIIINECVIESNEVPIGWVYEHTPVCPNYPTLTKQDNIPDGHCVGLGNEIIYNIRYDANGYGDTNIVITDYLPTEVTYRSSDPCGFYDCNSHTVRWNIGTLSHGSGNSVKLKVRMKCPNPGSIITNYCEIKCGEDVLASAYEHTPVCATPGVLYYDNFNGPNGAPLNGTIPDISRDNEAWQAGEWIFADGQLCNGISGSMFTAAVPFTPITGAVYELSADIDNEGDWMGIGFLDTISNLDTRILDNGPQLWILIRGNQDPQNDMAFIGPGNGGGGSLGYSDTSSAETVKVRIELNSETNWRVTWYFNGSAEFQETIDPTTWGLELNYAAFGSNGLWVGISGYISNFALVEIPHPDRICIPESRPAADFNCDCIVDFRDFCVMANEWFEIGCVWTDLNEDDKVDSKDLHRLVDKWLKIEGLWPVP